MQALPEGFKIKTKTRSRTGTAQDTGHLDQLVGRSLARIHLAEVLRVRETGLMSDG